MDYGFLEKYTGEIEEIKGSSNDDFKLSRLFFLRGSLFLRKKEYQRAIEDYTEGLNYKSKDEIKASFYFYRGFSYVCIEMYYEGIEDLNKALEIRQRLSLDGKTMDCESILEIHINLGYSYGKICNLKESEKNYLLAHSFIKSKFDYNPDLYAENLGTVNFNLGNVKCKEQKYREAINYYRDAINIFREYGIDDNSLLINALKNRGKIYSMLNLNELALSDFNEALYLLKKYEKTDEFDQELYDTYLELGNGYYKLGRYDEAFEAYLLGIQVKK